MWTCQEISGRMPRSATIKPLATLPGGDDHGHRLSVLRIDRTIHMSEHEESDRHANNLPDSGLIIDSDAWQKSLPVTAWTVLRNADLASVEHFARRYATPIYCYFRRHNIQRDEAKDLTQSFIADKVLQKDFLKQFKPGKDYEPGRRMFRSYLLPALKNHLIDFIRERNRKRMLQVEHAVEGDQHLDLATGKDVEDEVICRTVHDQLKEVLLSVQADCERDGLQDHFRMFCLRHFARPKLSWKEIGLGFDVNWQEAKNRAWTVRDRLKKAVLAELGMQGMSQDEVLEEVRELRRLLKNFVGTGFSFEDWGNE